MHPRLPNLAMKIILHYSFKKIDNSKVTHVPSLKYIQQWPLW